MAFRYFSILIFLFNSTVCFSQWGAWEQIYSDSDITVELQYKLSSNSCDQGGKSNKFHYKVTGNLKSYDYYVNWKMDYVDCNGNVYFQQYSINIGSLGNLGIVESMDYIFQCTKLIKPFYENIASYSSEHGKGIKPNLISKDPESIIGMDKVSLGGSIDLMVNGGLLGSAADWVWYETKCGGVKLGSGSFLNVSPVNTTTYFVRAEGASNNTNCVEKTIKVVSKIPDRIVGNTEIYEGEETALTIEGGKLTIDAMWVWYTYDASYNLQKIGTGASIKVKPLTNAKYYVRAESANDISDKVEVNVNVKPNAPTTILGKKSVVFGASTTLTVEGGFLLPNQEYQWYEEKAGGRKIGNGQSIVVAPFDSTMYFVRIEGVKYFSDAVSASVLIIPEIGRKNSGFPHFNSLNFERNSVININYEISGARKEDRFDILIKGINKNKIILGQKKINVKLSNLNNGKGLIKWDYLQNDSLYKDKIYFELEATNNVNIPTFNHLLKSVAFPGWGDYRLRNKKYYFLFGVLSYSLLYGSYHFNQVATKNYNDYKLSYDSNAADNLFNKAVLNRNLSYASVAAAAIVWSVDLTAIIVKARKLKKDVTPSKYYSERDKYVFTGRSRLE